MASPSASSSRGPRTHAAFGAQWARELNAETNRLTGRGVRHGDQFGTGLRHLTLTNNYFAFGVDGFASFNKTRK